MPDRILRLDTSALVLPICSSQTIMSSVAVPDKLCYTAHPLPGNHHSNHHVDIFQTTSIGTSCRYTHHNLPKCFSGYSDILQWLSAPCFLALRISRFSAGTKRACCPNCFPYLLIPTNCPAALVLAYFDLLITYTSIKSNNVGSSTSFSAACRYPTPSLK